MTSCGIVGTHYIGGAIIEPSDSNSCKILSHDPVQNTAAAPAARCCTFPAGVITDITTVKSSNTAGSITTTCPSETVLTGCNVYYASGTWNGLLGTYSGDQSNPPQDDAWIDTDNTCKSGARSGTNIWGGAQCLHVADDYRLECVAKAKYTSRSNYGTCGSGYEMFSCMTWTRTDQSWTLDAYYVQSDHACYVQQDNHRNQYANAICCKLIKGNNLSMHSCTCKQYL